MAEVLIRGWWQLGTFFLPGFLEIKMKKSSLHFFFFTPKISFALAICTSPPSWNKSGRLPANRQQDYYRIGCTLEPSDSHAARVALAATVVVSATATAAAATAAAAVSTEVGYLRRYDCD